MYRRGPQHAGRTRRGRRVPGLDDAGAPLLPPPGSRARSCRSARAGFSGTAALAQRAPGRCTSRAEFGIDVRDQRRNYRYPNRIPEPQAAIRSRRAVRTPRTCLSTLDRRRLEPAPGIHDDDPSRTAGWRPEAVGAFRRPGGVRHPARRFRGARAAAASGGPPGAEARWPRLAVPVVAAVRWVLPFALACELTADSGWSGTGCSAKARSGVLCLPNGYSNPERRQTAEMIVRISKGTFPLDRLSDAERALWPRARPRSRDALQQMPGLVRYYVAIDRDAGQLTNTSVWDSLEHATAMSAARPDARPTPCSRSRRCDLRADHQSRHALDDHPLTSRHELRRPATRRSDHAAEHERDRARARPPYGVHWPWPCLSHRCVRLAAPHQELGAGPHSATWERGSGRLGSTDPVPPDGSTTTTAEMASSAASWPPIWTSCRPVHTRCSPCWLALSSRPASAQCSPAGSKASKPGCGGGRFRRRG